MREEHDLPRTVSIDEEHQGGQLEVAGALVPPLIVLFPTPVAARGEQGG